MVSSEEMSSSDGGSESEDDFKNSVPGPSQKQNIEKFQPASESTSSSSSDEAEEREDVDSETDATAAPLRKELSHLSFEELEDLKQKLGTKAYNEAMFGTKSKSCLKKPKIAPNKIIPRENKNRPREMSSKIRVPKLRQVVNVHKRRSRDPRFESLCGEFNEQHWKKHYSFLTELERKEAEEMAKTIKSETDPEKRLEMKRRLQKFKIREKEEALKLKKEEKMRLEKQENKQRIKEGKKPYYMKKSTRKLLDLADKYDDLKNSGKLDKFLKKKRKKNATRDRKGVLPTN